MKKKISQIAIFCLIALTCVAKPQKVLRVVCEGEILQEYHPGEFDAIEYLESESVKGEINGYEYVDLGLPSGVKWATCNIGANSPEEYGDYYQWGETDVEEEPTKENCSTWLVQDMDEISGNPEYDAARANWGSTWRMPTYYEMKELLDFGEWRDGFLNGVAGMKVTGPNGNFIFLPYTGYRYGNEVSGLPGIVGSIWISRGSGKYNASRGYYSLETQHQIMQSRYLGIPIRPVSN